MPLSRSVLPASSLLLPLLAHNIIYSTQKRLALLTLKILDNTFCEPALVFVLFCFLQDFGKIDILVSNAAVNPAAAPLLNTPADAIDKILNINIKAALMLVQDAFPHMTVPGSSIVLVASVTAFRCGPLTVCIWDLSA